MKIKITKLFIPIDNNRELKKQLKIIRSKSKKKEKKKNKNLKLSKKRYKSN